MDGVRPLIVGSLLTLTLLPGAVRASELGPTPAAAPLIVPVAPPPAAPAASIESSAPTSSPALVRERSTPIGPVSSTRESASVSAPAPGAPVPSSLGSFTSMLAPLAVVVGVILIAAAVFRRLLRAHGSLASALGPAGKAPSGLLEVIGRYPISRGQSLVLLRLDRRVMLLSHTTSSKAAGGGFSTLCEITEPEDVASILMKVSEHEGVGPGGRFEQLLKSFEGQMPDLRDNTQREVKGVNRDGDRAELWRGDVGADEIRPIPQSRFTPESMDGSLNLKHRLAALRGRALGDHP